MATIAALLALPAASAAAQGTPATVTLPFTVSGTLFANYQYHTDNAGTPNANFNKFDLERIYLNFAGGAGDNGSFRVTTDVFQQTNAANASYYAGWVVRIKYAYFQYDFRKTPDWGLFARLGIVHTPIIDLEEVYWPRWLAQVPLDHGGWTPSADAGIAAQLTLPNKLGALYGTITNGPGYTGRETDRFKDFSARLSLTPFAGSYDIPLLSSFVVAPWYYKGALARKFAAGGAGQIGPVGAADTRDRYGVFAAIKDPTITVGGEWAGRTDTYESGSNTLLDPRVASDSTGRLLSAFVLARPTMLFGAKSSPFGVMARYDDVKLVSASTPKYHVAIFGLTYDLSSRASISADHQEELPDGGLVRAPVQAYYAHLILNF